MGGRQRELVLVQRLVAIVGPDCQPASLVHCSRNLCRPRGSSSRMCRAAPAGRPAHQALRRPGGQSIGSASRCGATKIVGLIGQNGAARPRCCGDHENLKPMRKHRARARTSPPCGHGKCERGIAPFPNMRPFRHLPIIANSWAAAGARARRRRRNGSRASRQRPIDALEFVGISAWSSSRPPRLLERRSQAARGGAPRMPPSTTVCSTSRSAHEPGNRRCSPSDPPLHKGGRFGRRIPKVPRC